MIGASNIRWESPPVNKPISNFQWKGASTEKPSSIEKPQLRHLHTLMCINHFHKIIDRSTSASSEKQQFVRMRFNQLTVRRVTANHSVISIDLDGLYVEECIALLRRVESSSGGGRDREHPYLPDLRQQNQSGNHRQPIGAYAVDGGIIYERHEDNPPPNVPPTPPNVPNYLWINIIANVLTPSQVRQRVARIPRPEVGWRYVTVVYLNVEWGEQTEVKSMGAIWCGSVKKWVSTSINYILKLLLASTLIYLYCSCITLTDHPLAKRCHSVPEVHSIQYDTGH